ncbi:penicillin-binding protein activator [Novosphingobium sp. B 225]|uniref:penicillin-binding protein activator n=1 Tax=Novosphingobium sp. B 225 TaxID=1961849 RepID=UPI00159635EB|nr:penicillin-binding protein activator [Novosphingobium sp. B 225]
MFEGRMNRRKLVALGAVVLLAGCKVIPKGVPEPTPPPTPAPTDGLPADQARHRVALLVPLTGPNAAVGQSIANATTMALLDTNAKNLRITTYDIASGPAAAASKAISDGNRLILGPIQAEDVPPIATIARAARVPLVTYTGSTGVAARDVFVMSTVPEASLARTVVYAVKTGSKRFALLAPKGEYGQRAAAAYAEAVKAAGGTLVQTQTYDRSNTSVISAAQRMKTKGGFDAVLIADSARFAVQAAAQLKAPGAVAPRILGPELWNGEASVYSSPALRGALFSAISDTRFRTFADSYKSRFGVAPYRLATMGYDSVLLSIRIARDWQPGTPFPLARVTDTGGFLGIDGPFRFGAGGVIDRALEVRQVQAKGVGIVSAAPDRFTD